jgi:superfamily II DNA/RNA helicase
MWTKGSDITSAPFIGGANIKGQLANLKKHPQIIVGTTGRLLELIKMRKLKMHQVKTIVVDEFDVLIAQEHVDNLKSIIKTTLKERQLLFFSATLSERTEQIAQELMQQPHIVQIQSMGDTAPKAEHLYLLCEQREKIEMIPKIMRLGKVKALVFINDLSKIPEIEAKLKYNGMSLGVLTGETKKNERQLAMNNFRQGKISLLVATDLAARGLDIEGVTHVINWDLPTSPNQYIHRAGRTARMGATGTVISIVTKGEENILKRITGKLDVAIKKKRLYKGKMFDSK